MTTVNDKYACTFVIDRSQWQICVHICHWPRSMTNMHWNWVWFKHNSLHICHWPLLSGCKCKKVSKHFCHWPQSMTNMQWKWVWFRLSKCTFVIDHGQWQICIKTECDLNTIACTFVIDHGQWQICIKSEFDLDSVDAHLSLTTINDKYALKLSVI